jgi:hypothetical protein
MANMLPVPKRDQKRARVWLAGRIGGQDWQQDVHIRDLSEGGALLTCEFTPPLDEMLSLACGSVEVSARVAWVGNHFVGLEFLAPIDTRLFTAQADSSLRVSAPRTYNGFDLDEE